jgi:hypothetical protein
MAGFGAEEGNFMYIFVKKRLKKYVWIQPVLYRVFKRKLKNNTIVLKDQPISLKKNELIVVCVVRDGGAHIEEFVNYYCGFGAKYIVFMDNGSVDNTLELAKKYENVIVLQNLLPFKKYNRLFNYYLFDNYCRNGWGLIVDIDERFSFPGDERISLEKFIEYLSVNKISAVTSQMLDLYSCEKMSCWPRHGDEIVAESVWYDNTFLVRKRKNFAKNNNKVTNRDILGFFGGIRKKKFEAECFLTKHPLLNYKFGARPSLFSVHLCVNAVIGDISCLLKHYKFDSRFYEYCKMAIEKNLHYNNSAEYKLYMEKIRDGSFTLDTPEKKRFKNTQQLVDEGFLVVSGRFSDYLNGVDL